MLWYPSPERTDRHSQPRQRSNGTDPWSREIITQNGVIEVTCPIGKLRAADIFEPDPRITPNLHSPFRGRLEELARGVGPTERLDLIEVLVMRLAAEWQGFVRQFHDEIYGIVC